MANNFSQYTVAVLLILLTTSSVVMARVASSSEVVPETKCSESLGTQAGQQECDATWCANACKHKHVGQEPLGICSAYYDRPDTYCLCFFKGDCS
ncbi:hypothetical protein PIB30_106719 [Stylosanthes scabra]|uniref:Uncharacterized protein n=1 Tax=Stylosanthes scabra TaxID=79078 RepID=A0ABU6ZXH0_9FABA|nr:hypothetical protein [Stylosanthes scabra]